MRAALLFVALIHPALAQPVDDTLVPTSRSTSVVEEEGFHWKEALLQSSLLLAVQHASRMAQPKTRIELGGPFWNDYFDSVSSIHTWNDGNPITTNYIGHPLMGAVTGYIQVFNDPRGRRLEFDLSSKRYWNSRLKALAWSAAYSAQFEIGPIGEASIGNVGMHPPTMAVVDMVVTPVGGFTWLLLEDYVDKRFIAPWERVGGWKAGLYRIALNPARSIANVLRWMPPAYRDTRPF